MPPRAHRTRSVTAGPPDPAGSHGSKSGGIRENHSSEVPHFPPAVLRWARPPKNGHLSPRPPPTIHLLVHLGEGTVSGTSHQSDTCRIPGTPEEFPNTASELGDRSRRRRLGHLRSPLGAAFGTSGSDVAAGSGRTPPDPRDAHPGGLPTCPDSHHRWPWPAPRTGRRPPHQRERVTRYRRIRDSGTTAENRAPNRGNHSAPETSPTAGDGDHGVGGTTGSLGHQPFSRPRPQSFTKASHGAV